MRQHTAAPILLLAPLGVVPALGAQPDATAPTPTNHAADLLADAASRVSLTPGSTTYKGGFRVLASDERFSLRFNGTLQFRYFAAFDADGADDDDRETGFQFRRTRLDFRGHIGAPDLSFRVQTDFGRTDGTLDLLDAYIDQKLTDGLTLRVGQAKLPFDREFSVVSGSTPQLLDRSVVSDVFRLDYAQGVMLVWTSDRTRVSAMLSDGRRSANTNFTDADEADLALTARGELRLGDAPWSQYGDLVSFRGSSTGAMLGAGLHWQEGGATTNPFETDRLGGQYLAYTADGGYESDGWSAFAAVNGQLIEANDETLHDMGFVVQGGVFVTDRTELSGRFSYTMPDTDRTGGDDPFPEFSVATTYYIIPSSHAFKVTAMLTWLPEAQADSASLVRAPNTGFGFERDASGGQFLVGLGVQVRF